MLKPFCFTVPPLTERRDERFLAFLGGPLLLSAGLMWPWIKQWLSLGPCRYMTLTGEPCIFCGGTRGIQLIMQGKWGEAFHANPLIPFGVLFFFLGWLYLLAASLNPRVPVLRRRKQSPLKPKVRRIF